MTLTYVMCLCLVALCVAVCGRSISEPHVNIELDSNVNLGSDSNVVNGSDSSVLLRVKRNFIIGGPGNGCAAGHYRLRGRCHSCSTKAKRHNTAMKVCNNKCVEAHIKCDGMTGKNVLS